MADKRFDLVFNASLEVGQVKSAVASLTKSLENAGAKIPQSMASNLNRMIQTLNTELNKLEGMTDIQLDPKNAKNVGKSYEKIFQTFQMIKAALGDIHRTAGIDPEKFFPSEIASNIAKAAQAVQKYKKAMETGIKTDEHTKATKDIAEAEKKVKSLNDKLDEAARKRQSSSIVKDQLQETRKKLQAEKDQAEAEDKAAKEAQKVIQDKIKSQEKLAQIEEEIAKKKKKQQEAVNKAARANEIKNEREGMKQAKGKGTDTKAYRDAVASYQESTAEVQKLQGEITQLEAEYAQLSQTATVAADEITAANERATKAANELSNAQKRLNKNQADIDAQDTKYAAATADVKTLAPEVQKAEDALNQLIQKREQLEANFEQSVFDELIQELEKLGIKLPDTERNMEGVERALDELANKAKGEVATALEGVKKAAEDVETPLKQTGQAAENFDQMADSAKHAEQDMENLKNQVLDFFSITNTIQIFKNAIRDAFDTVKELDAAMTETAVVTDFSIGDMWDKLPEYSEQATKLGTSIKSLYEATTLYYQQGLDSNQAMGVGIETMKMARIANMDAAEATEAMTAALRGFNMEINEASATRINDVYSELAAVTAADTSQIATAMSKTASIAESANMEFETTAALLAQIIETTQEAPETAGTAMKTIIARFTEVKQLFSEGMLTGEDSEGEEININKIDAALKTVGISLKDFLTGAKGIDDIFLELASKWDTLDLATQRYIATTAAGSRQQSRFLAMMGNYDRTMELVTAANNSAGASQKQFGKTLDSLEAKLQKLKNAWDTFVMGLANSEIVKGGVDLLTLLLEGVNKLTEAFDGVGGSVAKIGLAIAALKTGKGLFNVFTGQAYSAGSQVGAKFATGLVASLSNISIEAAAQNLENNLTNISQKMSLLNQGSLIAGMGLKFLAQQMENSEYSEYADEISNLGTAFLVLSGILKVLTPIAAAANTSIIGLITTVIGAIGPVGLLVGAIVALVGALAFEAWKNSPDQVLKRTKESAEEAAQAAEEAAQKYNELQNSLSSLSNSETALEGMTVGTQEWRDAVVELNDEILRLVELYPELGELVGFKDGHLTIDYESERGQEISRQLQSQVVASQIASVAAKASVVKQEEKTYYYDNIYGFNPLVSQAEAVEKLADAIYKDYSSFDTRDEIIEWLNNNNLKDFASDENAVNNLYNNKDKLYEYGQERSQNQSKLKTYDTLTQSSLISAMDTEQYNERVLNLLGKIQVPVQEYADGWRENSQVNKTNFSQVGKVIAESIYGEGATASINHWNNEVTLSNKDGSESRTMSFDQFKDEAAYYKGAQQASQQLEAAAQTIAQMSEGQQQQLENLLSFEGTGLDLTALKEINLAGGVEEYVSKTFGTDVAEKFEDIFGYSFEALEENVRIATERVTKERGALVKKMSKYSSKEMEGYEVNAGILAGLELKFGEKINSILDGVLGSLEQTGDEALVTKGFEQFRNVAMKGTKQEMEEIASFIEDVDWTNPIEAVDRLNQELVSGSELTKQYAQGMLEVGSSFLGAGSQMQHFFKTEEYEAVKEDLDDIIAKNDEISAADVLDLAGEYKSLNKILKNTDATAGGLAKTLELIAKGELGVHQLTDAVMASLEGFDSLNSLVAETLKTLSEFDPGMDENEVADFVNTAYETISENLKAGAVGNSQNFGYLDFMFPGWDKGLEGDDLVAQMQYLTGKLKENSTNMRRAWSDLAAGKDIYGEAIAFDEDSEWGPDDLNVDDTGSSIKLTGWEDKGMTTQDMVDWISDAYNVSENYAKMMLADFKNYSADLAQELNANDYSAGIEKAYEKLRTVRVADPAARSLFDQKVIDESEIQAIATLYNKNIKDVRAEFEGKAFITDFYDENGFLRQTSDIMAQLDSLAQSGGAEGAKWINRFLEGADKNLNVTKLNDGLSEVGIPQEAQARITQDIINSMLAASENNSVDVKVKLSDGTEDFVTVTPQIDLQTAINNAETELANSKLAESIAAAFKNITFSPEVNGQDITNSVIGAIKAADGTIITIVPDQESLNTITTSINGAASAATPYVQVNSNVNSVISAINSISKTVTVTVKYEEQGKPSSSSSSNSSPGVGGTSAYWDTQATGIKNAPYSRDSLVSEEGPELIQKADGGAYLTGLNGPEIAHIEKGDTVYTAEETKQIFKKRNHPIISRFAEGYGYGNAYWGSGSGGKSSDDDEDTWENPFDKLYNLVRKIDEELRQRERIERRYEKLLENLNVSANKIVKVSREELAQLERERMLQEQLISGRKYQISQYQSENADLTKYANVVQNDRGEDVLRINWDLINSVTDTDEGQRIEDYVSQLEEWFDSLEEAEDALWDIEDAVEEIKERGEEEYFELEDTIKDALAQSYQDEIDKLSEINDSINDTNSSLLDAIQNSIDKQRQDRDNQRTEDDLAEKQRRLLYLQQDTSGANAMEILRLQDEIAQGQEDYTDTLIDQKISELQEQNDAAAKQREQQITIAQAQLDHYIETGRIWQEVYGLMDEGLDPDGGLVRGTRLESILKSAEGYEGMSEIAKMEWMNDTNNMIAQALAYLEIGRQLEDIGVGQGAQIEFTTTDGRKLTGTVNADGSVTGSDGKTYNNVFQGYDGNYYAGENIADVEEPTVESPSGGQGGGSSSSSSTTQKKNPYGTASSQGNYTVRGHSQGNYMSGSGVKAIQWALNDMGYNAGTIDGIYGYTTHFAVQAFQGDEGIQADGDYGPQTREKMRLRGYQTGGLADFTGPAWLDGTKARPELVLNARDTQNFIQLKDILASLMTGSNTSTENNGDITYDIDINVESIGSDYDVEQVANKVKSLINEDARYRNNNAVSLKR